MKKIKKLVFNKQSRMRIFVKKPIKGGIPAIEKREIVMVVRKKKLNLKSENENKVLILKLTNCVRVQKISKRDML